MIQQNGPGLLVAILLNPPLTTSGERTRKAVGSAARVLGYEKHEISNLCTAATTDVAELSSLDNPSAWTHARIELAASISRADGLLAGWGVAGMAGEGLRALQDQLVWLTHEALNAGIDHIWMVNNQPRHPSRWHQYTADKHGRTSGGSFEDRLAELLVAVPLATMTSV